MKIICDNIWLCDDCTIWAVNADCSGMSEERYQEVSEGLSKFGPHLAADFDAETGEGLKEFTWAGCDACCSGGGSKHRFALLGESEEA